MIPTMKNLALAGVAAVALTSITALGTAHAETKTYKNVEKVTVQKNGESRSHENAEQVTVKVAAKSEAEAKPNEKAKDKAATGRDRAANSECVASITDMQANYRESTVRYDPELRADVRTLREAAYTLAYNGDEEGCRWMLQKIEDMREKAKTEGDGTVALQERRMERLDEAEKLTEIKGAVRAEMLLGADVVNMKDEDLGAVEDVILNGEGKPSYVLISHGGLFGLGDNLTPVSIKHLKKIQGEDTLVLNIAEEKFEEAPEYDDETAQTSGLEAWSQDVENWWEKNAG